ncbi:hypothetical protein [Peribacillus frigoritolerans]|uniref:hypothetical protein n=1 Tax=Peribacillus frigoritolerans TaxID=450367 RepID=UPI001059C1E2|nr:hypothetical protein [Peribacillus frigoritolerans]TDL78781.1 hypothetical protein E2R53_15150 [Peribacillus frigoritolerans]
MKKFTQVQFLKAREFMLKKARKVDRALFLFDFENGSKEDVLMELKAYQNEDGGFGNGLEPDFRYSDSSALASTIGMQYLSRVNANEEDDILNKVIAYFVQTFHTELPGWEKVPPEVESAPRAPWWNYQKSGDDWGNPNAEILGYLFEYERFIPESMLSQMTDYAIGHLRDIKEYEFHELLCYLRLTERGPQVISREMTVHIDEFVNKCIIRNPEDWKGYGLQPAGVIQSPSSRYYPLFSESVEQNLDFIIGQQTDDGSFAPAWSWGQYEETWLIAREEWKGSLTLEKLRLLREFNRIEGL